MKFNNCTLLTLLSNSTKQYQNLSRFIPRLIIIITIMLPVCNTVMDEDNEQYG